MFTQQAQVTQIWLFNDSVNSTNHMESELYINIPHNLVQAEGSGYCKYIVNNQTY